MVDGPNEKEPLAVMPLKVAEKTHAAPLLAFSGLRTPHDPRRSTHPVGLSFWRFRRVRRRVMRVMPVLASLAAAA